MSLARLLASGPASPLRRWFWLWLGALTAAAMISAQTPEERLSFDAALRSFEGGLWERAATEFDEFTAKFPKSELKSEVEQRRLYAQAELDLANTRAQTHLPAQKRAGRLSKATPQRHNHSTERSS